MTGKQLAIIGIIVAVVIGAVSVGLGYANFVK